MARMIDGDALYETVSEHVTTVSVCPTAEWARGKTAMKEIGLEDIKNASTVDAVQVVRCKDCINAYSSEYKGYIKCTAFGRGGLLLEDWFCADGRRKT